MTTYTEKTLNGLLTGAADADGDTISVFRINDVIPSSWPYSIALSQGTVRITQAGQVTFDDGGDTSQHPASGTLANGSFTFTLWDGQDESPAYTASVVLEGVATVPARPEPAIISNETETSFDVTLSDEPDDGGDPIIRRVVALIPQAEFDAGVFTNAAYLIDFDPAETRTIDAASYPGLSTAQAHSVRWKAINSTAENGGHGAYSEPVTAVLAEAANPPAFTSQPRLTGGPFTVGDVVTLEPGAGAGDNPVTVSIEYFRLGAQSKLGELSGLDWDSSGEAAGTITFRTRLTDDVTGAFVLSEEQSAPLSAEATGGVPPGFTAVHTQVELDGAISNGVTQIYLNAPGQYDLSRSVGSLPQPFTLQGTASTVVDIALTGSAPGLDVSLRGFKVTTQSAFQASVRTMERDGLLFHGPASGVRGSEAYDRMLRATVDLSGLSAAPYVGQAIANSNGTASSTITKVYDWNAGAGTATVAINEVPHKSVGGTTEGSRWAAGQGLRLDGAAAGTVASGIRGGDPLVEDAIIFSTVSFPQHDVYRNCEFVGWAQQIAAFGSVSTVIENNSFSGFIKDSIKVFRRAVHPGASVTIRGNRIWGVLANTTHFANPHSDAVQFQPDPVNTPVPFTGHILIENNISTARGYLTDAYLQGLIIHQHNNTNITIRNYLHDCLNGPRGISGAGSTLTCTDCTFISSDPGDANGGNRLGRVDMTGNGASSFTGCITEDFIPDGLDTSSIEMGKFGGTSGNGQYATHFQAAQITDTGNPIADLLAWLTPKSAQAQTIGAVAPDGALRS